MEPMVIKETPEQQAMRKEQERVRQEMHIKSEERKNEKVPTPAFADQMIFRVKRWTNGSFSGLWMLEVLNKQGKTEEVIMDAETLPAICEAIGNIFANRGF